MYVYTTELGVLNIETPVIYDNSLSLSSQTPNKNLIDRVHIDKDDDIFEMTALDSSQDPLECLLECMLFHLY